MAASDKLATAELTIAKDQLKSLHGTVMKINQERAEVSSRVQNKFPPVLLLSKNITTCITDLLTDFGYLLNHYKVVCFLSDLQIAFLLSQPCHRSCTLLNPERNHQMKHTIPPSKCRDLLREIAVFADPSKGLKGSPCNPPESQTFHLVQSDD